MLTIETYIAPSGIHGIGLFTKTPVEAGVVVAYYASYVDRLMSKGKINEMPQVARDFYTAYAFCIDGQYMLWGDSGRFINHALDGNLSYLAFVRTAKRAYFYQFVALRAIPSGAELTADYSTFDLEQYERISEFKELREAALWPPKITEP